MLELLSPVKFVEEEEDEVNNDKEIDKVKFEKERGYIKLTGWKRRRG